MKKGFISIISLVAVLALSAILGAGVYYQHNKKISASLAENVNQNVVENKEDPEEIKTELDPVESAPEEVKQEEPEIETVDVKNDVVETAEVKTDDKEKIDEELKKAEEARKQAEIARKKAEEGQRKLQEQIRVAEENRVKEEAERKQAEIEEQKNLAEQARIAEENRIKEEQRLEAEKIAKEQAEKEAEEANKKAEAEAQKEKLFGQLMELKTKRDNLKAQFPNAIEERFNKVFCAMCLNDKIKMNLSILKTVMDSKLQEIEQLKKQIGDIEYDINFVYNPYAVNKHNELTFEHNKLVGEFNRYRDEHLAIANIAKKMESYLNGIIDFSKEELGIIKEKLHLDFSN